jgi:hypothetical protein
VYSGQLRTSRCSRCSLNQCLDELTSVQALQTRIVGCNAWLEWGRSCAPDFSSYADIVSRPLRMVPTSGYQSPVSETPKPSPVRRRCGPHDPGQRQALPARASESPDQEALRAATTNYTATGGKVSCHRAARLAWGDRKNRRPNSACTAIRIANLIAAVPLGYEVTQPASDPPFQILSQNFGQSQEGGLKASWAGPKFALRTRPELLPA